MTPAFTAFIRKITMLCSFVLGFILVANANEPTSIIKGIVTTADGKPAAWVTVKIKGTAKSAITNETGSFAIRNLAAGTYTIEISLVGYETAMQQVSVGGNETKAIAVQLQLSQTQLQEVIINSNRNKFTRSVSEYVAKMPLRNLENPQVYSSITKELIGEQLIFSVEDATKNVPGLQKMWESTGRGGDGGAYYNSRGFILQSQLRNGVAGNVSSNIDIANTERIEVIKGPSATLFGSTLTSYGGLINRVTKKPLVHFTGELSYSSGSYSFNRISADINSPLDAAKKVLFRVNTAYTNEGSFQDNGYSKLFALAPSFSYQVNDRLSFQFDAELFSGENTGRPFIFFYYPASQLGASRAEELGLDYKRSYSSNDIFQKSRSSNYFAQMNYKLSPQWTSQTVFSSTNSYSDGPLPYFYLLPNTNRPGADSMVRAVQSTANSTMQVAEIQQNFIGDFSIGKLRNRVAGGLDFFVQNSNQFFYGADFDVIPKNGTIATYRDFNKDNLNAVLQDVSAVWTWPYEYKTNTYSAYVSDVLNITDRLIASAALRVDYFDNKGSYDEASGKYSNAYQQTAFSPRVGLVYQLLKNKVSAFANIQNGFTNQQGVDFNGHTFKPEEATQYEAGMKVETFSGKLNGTISYYNIKVRDVIRPDAGNPNFSIQDGEQRSKGFEVELIANPVRGFNVIAGFSYNDSKLEKADADVEGRRPATASSPYVANLWVSYKLPQGKLEGLGFGFGGNYASDNKILNSVYYGEFILPAYTVLNATVFYENPKIRLGLKADNLTNKQYWIGYTTMNAQKLRSVTGSIAFKF
jgi:iron complex outermembrane recepter protein